MVLELLGNFVVEKFSLNPVAMLVTVITIPEPPLYLVPNKILKVFQGNRRGKPTKERKIKSQMTIPHTQGLCKHVCRRVYMSMRAYECWP